MKPPKPIDLQEVRELLVRIETDLGLVKDWREIEDATLATQGVVSYSGAGKRWQFLIVGKAGGAYMGTAVRLPSRGPGVTTPSTEPNIVKLTDELAAKAWAAARKA